MQDVPITPSIAVTIGEQQRVYHAFVTTAPPALDGPSTITLHASTFADVSGFAADPLVHNRANSKAPARLVLIESRELTWHRTRYRAENCLCVPADAVLVSFRTLQFWMWLRLQASLNTEVPE